MTLPPWIDSLTLSGSTMVLAALTLLCLVLVLWLDTRVSRFARFVLAGLQDLDRRGAVLAERVTTSGRSPLITQNHAGWKRLEADPLREANLELLAQLRANRADWVDQFEATGVLAYLRLDPFFRAIDPANDFQQLRQGQLLRPTQPSATLTAAGAYHRQYIPEHRFDPSDAAKDTLLGILAYREPVDRQSILDRFGGASEASGGDKNDIGYADEWDVFLSSLTPHFHSYVQLALSCGNFPPPVKVSHVDYDRILKTRRLKVGVSLSEEDMRKILTFTLMLCGAHVPADLLAFSPTLKGILLGTPLPLKPCEDITRGLEARNENDRT